MHSFRIGENSPVMSRSVEQLGGLEVRGSSPGRVHRSRVQVPSALRKLLLTSNFAASVLVVFVRVCSIRSRRRLHSNSFDWPRVAWDEDRSQTRRPPAHGFSGLPIHRLAVDEEDAQTEDLRDQVVDGVFGGGPDAPPRAR